MTKLYTCSKNSKNKGEKWPGVRSDLQAGSLQMHDIYGRRINSEGDGGEDDCYDWRFGLLGTGIAG